MPAHQIQTDAVQFSWYPLVFYPVEEKNKQTNKQIIKKNLIGGNFFCSFVSGLRDYKRYKQYQLSVIKARVGEEISSMRRHKRWRYLHYRASNLWLVGAKITTKKEKSKNYRKADRQRVLIFPNNISIGGP